MKIFEMMDKSSHKQLITCYDTVENLKAFIAIHNTKLGPAIGGVRMWNYSSEEAAMKDALDLSRNMTLRAGVSGCDLSGGSVVIMGNPKTEKCEGLFRALGRFIDVLDGRFIVTTELGTNSSDLRDIKRETPYVADVPRIVDENGVQAIATAWGAYFGILACVKEVFKVNSLRDIHISVQGVGNLGSSLIELMKTRDPQVQLSISDIDYDRMKRIQDKYPEVKILTTDEILENECDLLVPCAVGNMFSQDIIPKLRCKVIAGVAACLLTEDKVADLIHEKGILMAPDFVINTGGLIHIDNELKGDENIIDTESFRKIALTLIRILAQAREENISPYKIAVRAALNRIDRIAHVKNILAVK